METRTSVILVLVFPYIYLKPIYIPDAVTGAATLILAMGTGKTAARAIDETLN